MNRWFDLASFSSNVYNIGTHYTYFEAIECYQTLLKNALPLMSVQVKYSYQQQLSFGADNHFTSGICGFVEPQYFEQTFEVQLHSTKLVAYLLHSKEAGVIVRCEYQDVKMNYQLVFNEGITITDSQLSNTLYACCYITHAYYLLLKKDIYRQALLNTPYRAIFDDSNVMVQATTDALNLLKEMKISDIKQFKSVKDRKTYGFQDIRCYITKQNNFNVFELFYLSEECRRLEALTPKEFQVLQHILSTMKVDEICLALGIKERTYKGHLTSIGEKFIDLLYPCNLEATGKNSKYPQSQLRIKLTTLLKNSPYFPEFNSFSVISN